MVIRNRSNTTLQVVKPAVGFENNGCILSGEELIIFEAFVQKIIINSNLGTCALIKKASSGANMWTAKVSGSIKVNIKSVISKTQKVWVSSVKIFAQ